MTKSVCIATYNGSKYLVRQLNSVIEQIGEDDEIIVVDDCSGDDTVKILESYSDSRIKIYRNERNMRHVKSFERAISLSTKDLIFLCDQDDIWVKDRLQIFEDYFLQFPDVIMIASNFNCINDSENTVDNYLQKVSKKDSFAYRKNIFSVFLGKIGYFGCAMAFRKELKNIILPIPEYVEAHDLWIGMAANFMKSNLHIEEKTLLHRMHDNNASDLKRSFDKKIISRFVFLKSALELISRKRIIH